MASIRTSVSTPERHGPSPRPPLPPLELVEAKLFPPPRRPGTVARAGLVDRLRRGDGIVSVVAPAGYGKTTLLAEWVDRDRRPSAWVSIDDRDNDPWVLLTYIAVALDRVEPIEPSVFAALSSPGSSTRLRIVPRLGAAFASRAQPLVLVLDDVHTLGNPESLDAIAALAEHLPKGSSMAIAAREEPSLPLARLRASGRLSEIGAEDLALDQEEAGLLLHEAGLSLSPNEVADLARRTEGWPAGLYLASLCIRSGASEGQVAVACTGEDRFMADYFRSELLSRVPKSLRLFMTHTAVLDQMCGPLCDAVLERTRSARVLESLERSNLFMVPLDRRREWYRVHTLFRELLRAELASGDPELILDLHRRAAQWFEEHGMLEASIEHAFDGGDIDRAVRLFVPLALPTHRSGRMATVIGWLRRFDVETIERHPQIAVLAAWMGVLSGDAVEAERWAETAERAGSQQMASDGGAPIRSALALLRAAMCRDGVADMRQNAEVSLGLEPPSSPWRPVCLLALGVSHLLAGDDESADRVLADAAEAAEHGGATAAATVALAERSLLALGRGDQAGAEALATRAGRVVREAHLEDYSTSGLTYAAEARAAIRRSDMARTRQSLASAQRLRPLLTHALPWLAFQTRLELARAHLALSDPAGARTLLAEAVTILNRRPALGVLGELVEDLRQQAAAFRGPSPLGASTLTTAELRLLPLLATHLTFREIGRRLFVSPNTVKTQAISVYRKLEVSSRSGAIHQAREQGLLEA